MGHKEYKGFLSEESLKGYIGEEALYSKRGSKGILKKVYAIYYPWKGKFTIVDDDVLFLIKNTGKNSFVLDKGCLDTWAKDPTISEFAPDIKEHYSCSFSWEAQSNFKLQKAENEIVKKIREEIGDWVWSNTPNVAKDVLGGNLGFYGRLLSKMKGTHPYKISVLEKEYHGSSYIGNFKYVFCASCKEVNDKESIKELEKKERELNLERNIKKEIFGYI